MLRNSGSYCYSNEKLYELSCVKIRISILISFKFFHLWNNLGFRFRVVSIDLFCFYFMLFSYSGVCYDRPSNYISHPPFPSFQALKVQFSYTLTQSSFISHTHIYLHPTPCNTLHCTKMSKTRAEWVNGDYFQVCLFLSFSVCFLQTGLIFTSVLKLQKGLFHRSWNRLQTYLVILVELGPTSLIPNLSNKICPNFDGHSCQYFVD